MSEEKQITFSSSVISMLDKATKSLTQFPSNEESRMEQMFEQKDPEICCGLQIFVGIHDSWLLKDSKRQGLFKTFVVNVNENDKIERIANELSDKTGVPSHLLQLSYGTQQMDHKKSISVYRIAKNTTLNATINLKKFKCKCSKSLDESALPDSLISERNIDLTMKLLTNQYENKLLITNCIQTLSETLNSFNTEYKTLNTQKLECLKDCNLNNHQKQKELQTNIYMNQRAVMNINKSIDEVNKEIKRYQCIIENLETKKKVKEADKLVKKQELKSRKKSVNRLKHEYILIENKIIEIEKKINADQTSILFECLMNQLKKCESKYKKWNSKDVVEWIKLIENGQFRTHKQLLHQIQICIDGKSLIDLRNETCLKLMGLNLVERKTMLKNIDRVLNNEKIDDISFICTICADRTINCVFIPCGHQTVCFVCYQKQKRKFKNCPICRKKIKKTHKTFIAGF